MVRVEQYDKEYNGIIMSTIVWLWVQQYGYDYNSVIMSTTV